MLIAVVGSFSRVVSSAMAPQALRDSDTGWHIRNGESILAEMRLPRTDPYSFTMPENMVCLGGGADVLMERCIMGTGFQA